ncbi:MAG: hypothetical protein QOF68_938 [Gaiellales bacterium]|jgi:hypothetical protein|nr:hypothetical protein [Gaiellales bacterium]
MVETICPVVHGTRKWLVSVALFALGAVAAAAAVGLLLGAALPLGGEGWLAVVALVALVQAAAEARLLRLPALQVRRQVPEQWRVRFPLPLTALLYGLGLGLGFATYIPVATLLVVAVGVALVADPVVGAAVMAAFGLGRALALGVSTIRLTTIEAATGRIERMAEWAVTGRLRRLNAVALAALAFVCMLSATTGEARAARLDLGPDPVADPSADANVLAFDRINSDGTITGVVRFGGTYTDLPGITPDLDGHRVIVDRGPDFQIIDVTTMNVLRTIVTQGSEPALSDRFVVFRRSTSSGRFIVLFNLDTSKETVIAHSTLEVDLGAPDISVPRVTFHRTSDKRSSIIIYRMDLQRAKPLVRETRMAFANPSIDGTMVVFVRQTLGGMQLYSFNLSARKQTLLHQLSKRSGRYLWTTGINDGTFYATVYDAESSWITAI